MDFDKIQALEFQIKLLKKRISYLEDTLKDYLPFSIDKLLLLRGFKVIRKRETFDLIEKRDQNLFYSLLKSYYFRRVLRDVLFIKKIGEKEKELIQEKWGEVAKNYIAKIETLGIIQKKNKFLVTQFSLGDMGAILEWFIGEYLHEELDLETITNVKLKNLGPGGDIDVLARIGTKLVMIECKESPPNNISVAELKSIFDRVNYFKPDSFILLIDTTLSIKRNILDNINWILHVESQRLKEGVYQVKNYYYILTAKREILQNLAFTINLIV